MPNSHVHSYFKNVTGIHSIIIQWALDDKYWAMSFASIYYLCTPRWE
jgi:hypothetical protein